MACAVHMSLPRFEIGVGHCLYNGLRGARVCLGLRSGWGIAYIMACAVHVPASVCTRGGAISIRMACAVHVPASV